MKFEDIHPETPTEFLLLEILKTQLEILKELKKEDVKKKGK